MSALFRFPSRAELCSPALALPPPAGNPAHQAMPAAGPTASSSEAVGGPNWVLHFPFPPDPGVSECAGAPAPAAEPFGNAAQAIAAGAFLVHELPPAALDRPLCDPEEIEAAGGGPIPSPDPASPGPIGTREGDHSEPDRAMVGPASGSLPSRPHQSGVSGYAAAGNTPPSSSAAVGQQVPLPGTGPGGSIASVLALRLDQVRHGHTPESDAVKSLKQLTTVVRSYADRAREFAFTPHVDADHAAMRNKLVKTAAFALAAIDALDFMASTGGTTDAV